jgi:hypothetical protein
MHARPPPRAAAIVYSISRFLLFNSQRYERFPPAFSFRAAADFEHSLRANVPIDVFRTIAAS